MMPHDNSQLPPNTPTENNNTSKRFIRWVIVGVGDVVSIKSGPAFYKADGAQLVAVMRRTPGAAAAWARQFVPQEQDCQGYESLDTMLQDAPVDAVYIATPPGAHLSVANEIARAGKPAYVEKPVGRCAWETKALVKAFEDRGLKVFTAYVSRAFERTNTIVTLLSQEKVVGGRITNIRYTLKGSDMARGLDWSQGTPWRLDAKQSGGGLIMDVGCHVLDRIDYLCGPLVNVTGTAQNRKSINVQDVEDYVELQGMIGPSSWAAIPSEGASVSCRWDFSAEESFDELILSGPDGSLVMAAMSPYLPVRVLNKHGELVREITFDQPQHAAQPLVQEITNELLGLPGATSRSRGDNAIRTSAVLDAALDSYYGGRHDEFWLRPETWPGRKAAISAMEQNAS